MAMSKGKILASVAGGVFVLSAGVLGYLLYDAYATRTEMEEELEGQNASFRRYHQSAVFPSRKSIDSVVSNKADYAEWLGLANAFAARGDKMFSKDESPAAFKQRLTQEVRRLGKLSGGADGRIAAAGFMFGFDKYLDPERGVLPDAASVPRLAVQLDTISRFVDMFAKAGVLEVKEIKRIEPVADEGEDDNRRSSAKKKRRTAKSEEEGPKTTSLDYQISMTLRPAAFVDVLNALTSDVRFMVVKSFAFKETADIIVDKLNAVEAALAKKDAPSGGRRRRRRAMVEDLQENEGAPKKEDRLVVDPELDAPILVDMTVTVYDFGRPKETAAQNATAEAAKETK